MKATLTIGASRLTTDLSPDRMNTVLETFIEQIDDQVSANTDAGDVDPDEESGVLTDEEAEELFDLEDEADPVPGPLTPSLPSTVPKFLYHFKCPSCSRAPFVHSAKISPGDTIDCNCGKEIEVFSVREASGTCPKCGYQFWNIRMLNRRDSIPCKKCRSTISLVDAGNGMLGTDRR